MTDDGGPALKRAIHVARARAGVTSDMQLAALAQVSYDTLMNWFAGRTVPRGAELKKVANALGIRYAELEDAYEGRDPEPPPLQDAIRELVAEMRLGRAQQHEATLALLQAVAALTGRGRAPRGTPADTAPAAAADSRQGAQT